MKYFYFKEKKMGQKPHRYVIEASSSKQIIKIQLQLLVNLYCFKEVSPTYLIIGQNE